MNEHVLLVVKRFEELCELVDKICKQLNRDDNTHAILYAPRCNECLEVYDYFMYGCCINPNCKLNGGDDNGKTIENS